MGNQPNNENISQSGGEISQTMKISAKAVGKSAKHRKYQPKRWGNQPNIENISQSNKEISQTSKISAKAARKSAKHRKYQPKQQGNQPNIENISQTSKHNDTPPPTSIQKNTTQSKMIKVVSTIQQSIVKISTICYFFNNASAYDKISKMFMF